MTRITGGAALAFSRDRHSFANGDLTRSNNQGLLILSALATLQSLTALTNVPTLPVLPTLSSPSSRSIAVDVPLTVDVSDRVSLYAGFSASASQSGMSDWSTFAISSWNVGFQADVHKQSGGVHG